MPSTASTHIADDTMGGPVTMDGYARLDDAGLVESGGTGEGNQATNYGESVPAGAALAPWLAPAATDKHGGFYLGNPLTMNNHTRE